MKYLKEKDNLITGMISTLREETSEEAAEYQRHGVTSAGMRLMWQILSAAAPQLPLLILGRLHLCSLFTVQCWGHEVNNGNNHTMICRVQRCEAIIAAASVPGAGLRPTEVCPSHGGSHLPAAAPRLSAAGKQKSVECSNVVSRYYLFNIYLFQQIYQNCIRMSVKDEFVLRMTVLIEVIQKFRQIFAFAEAVIF